MTSLNLGKSTVITWLIGSPVYDATVLIASGAPPADIAALIFVSPTPSIGTRRSRGIDR